MRRWLLVVAGTACLSVSATDQEKLVDIGVSDDTIVLDMRYATTSNFTGQQLYKTPRCLLRKSIAEKIIFMQHHELKPIGLGFKIWDAYRPLSVQKIMWQIIADPRYVANPAHGSRHNRAAAVDLTLVDLYTKQELPMGTDFDDFSPRANRRYRNLPDDVLLNRQILQDVMTQYGFIGLPTEWWHYDDRRWENYDILDVPF